MSPYPSLVEPDYARDHSALTPLQPRTDLSGLWKSNPTSWGLQHLKAVHGYFVEGVRPADVAGDEGRFGLDEIRRVFAVASSSRQEINETVAGVRRHSWHVYLRQSQKQDQAINDRIWSLTMALFWAFKLATIHVRGASLGVFTPRNGFEGGTISIDEKGLSFNNWQILEWPAFVGPLLRTNGPPVAWLIDKPPNVTRDAQVAARHIALAQSAYKGYVGIPPPLYAVEDLTARNEWFDRTAVEERIQKDKDRELFFETFVVHARLDSQGKPLISFSAACIPRTYLNALSSWTLSTQDILRIRRTKWYHLDNAVDLGDVGETLCRIIASVSEDTETP